MSIENWKSIFRGKELMMKRTMPSNLKISGPRMLMIKLNKKSN